MRQQLADPALPLSRQAGEDILQVGEGLEKHPIRGYETTCPLQNQTFKYVTVLLNESSPRKNIVLRVEAAYRWVPSQVHRNVGICDEVTQGLGEPQLMKPFSAVALNGIGKYPAQSRP